MASNNNTLGQFLDYVYWENALNLLNFQVAQKEKNKHYNTVSMFYYERLGDAVDALYEEDYFEQKVANNLFYGLETEFTVIPYLIPKSGLGLRNYKFFTYPMRVLYYAVGLYLLKLSEDYLQYVAGRKRIKSYYGGKLYFQKDKLQITSTNTYFQKYYKAFRQQIRREISGDVDDKIVIRLDIQDYYDAISIPVLLQLLNESVKSSLQRNMNFDDVTTREQIAAFFSFVAGGGSGIAQTDNNLVSSFIGYLYLTFGDLLIEEELYRDREIVDEYTIVRYVDDTFISVTFTQGLDIVTREEYVDSLVSRVADILYHKLGLRLNPKTRLFWLDDEDQRDELWSTLKKVSPGYYASDEEDDEHPVNKGANIFDELNKLKNSRLNPTTFERELQEEILKDVYDKRVQQLLDKSENKVRIREIFDDFNFNLLKNQPAPLLIILLKDDGATQQFREFLLQKGNLTTSDADLIVKYLCQTSLTDSELVQKLRESEQIRGVIDTYLKADLASDLPGYYDLYYSRLSPLIQMPYVIEQIRLRVLSERLESYSVALNHLLNEIHSICYNLDGSNSKDHKNYNANDVVDFLHSQSIPHNICLSIRNLFDRRNTNQVSHTGSESNVSWGVSKEEYYEYRAHVGRCLESIL